MPKNNQEFWAKKLQGNKDRDKYVNRELRKYGVGCYPRLGLRELKVPAKGAAKLVRAMGTALDKNRRANREGPPVLNRL